jgi:predicted Fe-Mo cluster-binding NifX family protein
MKIAIPLCRQRIAPLFESAETFMLVSAGKADSAPTIREARRLRIDEKCHLY